MRKNICLVLLFACFVPLSCSSINSNKEINDNTNFSYDYSDVDQYTIEWKDANLQAKTHYFVYIYSLSCRYCNEFKEQIIYYCIIENLPIYFVVYNNEICISETAQYGEGKITCIVGTPSLLEIDNKEVINIASGIKEIRELLEFNLTIE